MALQDLLDGIVADAENRIRNARAEHKQRLSTMRTSSDRELLQRTHALQQQKEQKKQQLAQRARSHAAMVRRNALLSQKRHMLDAIYDDVIASVQKLPPEQLEAFYTACVKSIPLKGTLRPAKAHTHILKPIASKAGFSLEEPLDIPGGFVVSTDRQIYNYSLDFLVHELLRPATELEVTHSLFSRS